MLSRSVNEMEYIPLRMRTTAVGPREAAAERFS